MLHKCCYQEPGAGAGSRNRSGSDRLHNTGVAEPELPGARLFWLRPEPNFPNVDFFAINKAFEDNYNTILCRGSEPESTEKLRLRH